MFKIVLNGIIDQEYFFFSGEDAITLSQVREELKKAGGQDVEVDFSSIGGLTDVGVDIFFAFRDYKRENPGVQMILNVKSQSASMASHIAAGEFWDLVTVEDISSWMIHNPSNGRYGDYRVMRDNADLLERLARLYSGTYSKRSGKSEKEIKAMMDKTTYLFGQEIVDAGFADEVLKTDIEKDKPSMIAMLESKHNAVMIKSREYEYKNDVYEKVSARMEGENKSTQPAQGGNNKQEEITVKNSDELKDKFPTVHAETMQAGKDSGIENERERVKTLMTMKDDENYKNIPEVLSVIDKAISEGSSVDEARTKMTAAMVNVLNDPKKASQMRAAADSAADFSTGGDGTPSGEEDLTEDDDERF